VTPLLAPFAIALVAAAIDTNTKPIDGAPIDSAAALAGLEAVIAANPSSDYPAVIVDTCPMGAQVKFAMGIDAVVPLNPDLFEGRSHAWVNPDEAQPGAGCWIAYDIGGVPGIYWVGVYARSWNGGEFEGINWGDDWIRVDQAEEPFLNGTLHTGCVVTDDPSDPERSCIAQWIDPTVGLQFDVTLETDDGSVTAADAGAAMRAVLPGLAAALADNA
jgi:hypothetical protein